MPDSGIVIKIEGLDRVLKALDKFPRYVASYLGHAGEEAGKNLLKLEGLKKYPPAGPWNEPPTPYYIRGRGTQTGKGNTGSSQRMGTLWTVECENFGATIGNRASYAKYLHGEPGEGRVYWATSHGWLPLFATARRYTKQITETFQKWTNKLIKELGL